MNKRSVNFCFCCQCPPCTKALHLEYYPKREKVAFYKYSLMRIFKKIILCLLTAASGFPGLDSVTLASEHNSSNIEFFESRIRPVLAQDFYECTKTKGPK